MRTKGLSKTELYATLQEAFSADLKYQDGRILCSMCSKPHPAANKARKMFSESNLGDPRLFSGSAKLEREAVSSLNELMHGPPNVSGFIVSGGTEANLMAMHAARNASKVSEPEVVVPESAHFSFDKICDMLKLKLVKATLGDGFKVNPPSVKRLVNANTVAIVANAGSAELGTLDPISELSQIAQEAGIPLHVDAAFGGLILPFMKDVGYAVDDFDFGLEGVQSITVDPHKMGLAPIPAGGILFRDEKSLQCIRTETPYLSERYQYTFVGTRSGASAAAVWTIFESMGREGFRKTVKHCMNLTMFLFEELKKAGFEVVVKPTLNIVAFRSSSTKKLTDQLRTKGWYVSYIPRLDCIRVVLMPHSKKQHIKDFLRALRQDDKI